MPSVANTHVDQMLSNLAIGYRNDLFVAEQVAASIVVPDQSGYYGVFGRESWRPRDLTVTNSSDIPEVDYEVSKSTYYCGLHAAKKFVPGISDASGVFQNELMQTTDYLTDALLLEREKGVYDWVTSASNVTNSDSPSTKWDGTTPAIIKYLESRRIAVRKRCGRKPNVLLMGDDVWAVVANDGEILDRVKYTQTGRVTEATLQGLTDLKILVAQVVYDSANEGQAVVGADLWPAETALLAYQTPGGSTMGTPDSFKLFNWQLAGMGIQVSQIPDEVKGYAGGVWVKAGMCWDIRTTCNESAERITNILT